MVIANALLTIAAAILCVPAAMFSLEVLLAILPRRKSPAHVSTAGARVAVLIPAHNEQAVIGATLRCLVPTLPPRARALVVADNCDDDTAAIARHCGAEAIERRDRQRRGKGYALDFGIRHLQQDPPDAVVFLDADCQVGPDTVRLLGDAAARLARPVQGLNLCDPDPRGDAFELASGLAFRFKNLVRTVGLSRLAGWCHLTGTGMALPWPLIRAVTMAEGNLVEDMQLGIDLVLAGRPPLFLPEARVSSPLPRQRSAAQTQRTRWEHGHLATLLYWSPRLVVLSARHRRCDLLWLALDLAIPPLSLLVATIALAALVSAAWALAGGSTAPLVLLMAALATLLAAVIAGWAAHCRQQVPLRALVAAPYYVFAKAPIYFAFFRRRQQAWIRTARDESSEPSRAPSA
jgi:cellulose synthase/poly-beta-1,6-N-acetylglucosamine synthase-like glycosyltransferase